MIMRRLLYMMTLAAVLMTGCDKDTEPPQTPGGTPPSEQLPNEEPETPSEPDEPEEPENPEDPVFSEPEDTDILDAVTTTFSFYEIEGTVDPDAKRIDFVFEIYGADAPDLKWLPITFALKDGWSVKANSKEGYYVKSDTKIFMTLSAEDTSKVSFVRDQWMVEYSVCTKIIVKEAARTSFDFNSGINLAYWFQEGVPWTTEGLVQEVSAYGFDHVRIPFNSDTIFDAEGNIIRDHIDVLHRTIEECLDLGLNVILDMHWLRNGNRFYEEPAAQEIVNNWTKLIPEFEKYPVERVAYEILNEPHGNGWEAFQREMLHLMRLHEPERVLFISPQGYNADAVKKFNIHKGDPNLVITFHFYQPMLASHRKLWGYTGPSHYPGYLFSDEEWEAMTEDEKKIAEGHRNVSWDFDDIVTIMQDVAEAAALSGLRLHCGEFGYSKGNARDERLQWFSDVVKAFTMNKIAYTVWEAWGGDFGPGTISGSPDEDVIDILVRKP